MQKTKGEVHITVQTPQNPDAAEWDSAPRFRDDALWEKRSACREREVGIWCRALGWRRGLPTVSATRAAGRASTSCAHRGDEIPTLIYGKPLSSLIREAGIKRAVWLSRTASESQQEGVARYRPKWRSSALSKNQNKNKDSRATSRGAVNLPAKVFLPKPCLALPSPSTSFHFLPPAAFFLPSVGAEGALVPPSRIRFSCILYSSILSSLFPRSTSSYNFFFARPRAALDRLGVGAITLAPAALGGCRPGREGPCRDA